MSEPMIVQWRAAEACLGDPAAVERAARTLTPRLGALLRAMEALDAGQVAAVRALADELRDEHPDVAITLDLLLTPAAAVDREALRETRVSEELPYGELLDAVHVARTGRPASEASEALQHAAGYRPALHAVFRLLTDDETETFTNPLVQAFSPRADQLQVAARTVQLTGHTARTRLREHFGTLAMKLDAERWPELQHEVPEGDLFGWAKSRIAWSDQHDHNVALALEQGEPIRRVALGNLLHRVGRDAALGRLTGLARPVRAAFSLAWSLDPGGPLARTLAALQLRVDRFDPDSRRTAPALYVQLWRHAEAWPPDERLLVARRLVHDARSEALPEELLAAVGLVLATSTSSAEAGDLLLELVARRPPQELNELLQRHAAPAPRRVHLLGLHAASSGFLTHGLNAVSRLAAHQPADAEAIGQILRTFVGAAMRREHWPDELTAALAQAVQALTASSLTLAVWGPLLAHASLAERIPAEARATLLGASDLDHADPATLAASLLALGAWGEPERQREAVRQLGRRLRAADPAAATELALQTLAWCFAWNGGAARQHTAGWLRPVSLFVLREREAHAEAALVALPSTGPVVAGAVDWYLAHRAAPEVPQPWRERLRSLLSVPEEVRESFAAVTAEADLTGAHGLAAAASRLQEALSARLRTGG